MEDCFEISSLNTEKGKYSFKIDMGERVYIINCESNK
jgi:hypothetical protein